MPVPKRKTSKCSRDKRRTHYKAVMPTWTICSSCGEPTRPHHICKKCGNYDKREVIEVN